MAIELVFETHSITVDNEEGRATGWWPGRLSDQGRALAARLGTSTTGPSGDHKFTAASMVNRRLGRSVPETTGSPPYSAPT